MLVRSYRSRKLSGIHSWTPLEQGGTLGRMGTSHRSLSALGALHLLHHEEARVSYRMLMPSAAESLVESDDRKVLAGFGLTEFDLG